MFQYPGSDLSFRRNPVRWPADKEGMVFLFRAVNKAGVSKFQKSWSGKEIGVAFPDQLPPTPGLVTDRQFRGVVRRLRILYPGAIQVRDRNSITPEIWQIAIADAERQREKSAAAVERLKSARSILSGAITAGTVSAYLHVDADEQFKGPIKTGLWSAELMTVAFATGRFSLLPAYSVSVRSLGADNSAWIYVDARQLDDFLATVKPERNPVQKPVSHKLRYGDKELMQAFAEYQAVNPPPRNRHAIREWGKRIFGPRVCQKTMDELDKIDAQKHPRKNGRRVTARRANYPD